MRNWVDDVVTLASCNIDCCLIFVARIDCIVSTITLDELIISDVSPVYHITTRSAPEILFICIVFTPDVIITFIAIKVFERTKSNCYVERIETAIELVVACATSEYVSSTKCLASLENVISGTSIHFVITTF